MVQGSFEEVGFWNRESAVVCRVEIENLLLFGRVELLEMSGQIVAGSLREHSVHPIETADKIVQVERCIHGMQKVPTG